MLRLTDTHCHLDFPQFADQIDAVIARAHAAGVHRMITIATTTAGLARVQAIIKKSPKLFYAYGLHPLHVHEQPLLSLEDLRDAARDPRMVAIGESGLDYHYSVETRTMQIESLHIHIGAAQASGLPLVIHSRDADEDMRAILTERWREREYQCVMHSFTSGSRLARAALDLGFYLSISGIATFKNAQSVRENFRIAPIDRILVETDAPYLAPVPHRGQTNEPAFVADTAAYAASLFDMPAQAFAAQTEANVERLFPRVLP